MVFICFHVHRGRVFPIFLVTKGNFYICYIIFFIFECLNLMWFAILVPSKSGNHIVHNYHTMVKNDTLINQDSAHIIGFFLSFFGCKTC